MIKRIAITGPESTGKSWLAKHLSAHFGEPWVPEFSRAYLSRLSHPYTFNDVLRISRGQYRTEERMAAKADSYLFCDTDFLVTHIWCMVKYGRSHPCIDHMLETHRYHHHL
ncbi:MAG TPA: ATP-binding protein, partial [Lentimicrobium sp.]|nr:ATP-binding protein [Lentimicrobium sp.]